MQVRLSNSFDRDSVVEKVAAGVPSLTAFRLVPAQARWVRAGRTFRHNSTAWRGRAFFLNGSAGNQLKVGGCVFSDPPDLRTRANLSVSCWAPEQAAIFTGLIRKATTIPCGTEAFVSDVARTDSRPLCYSILDSSPVDAPCSHGGCECFPRGGPVFGSSDIACSMRGDTLHLERCELQA